MNSSVSMVLRPDNKVIFAKKLLTSEGTPRVSGIERHTPAV